MVLSRTRRLAFLVMSALALAFGVMFAGAASASAATVGIAPSAPDGSNDNASAISSMCGVNQAQNCLPLFRWKDATSVYHTYLSTGIMDKIDSAAKGTNGVIRGAIIGAGNFVWNGTVTISEYANNLNPLNKLGGTVDHVVAQLGTAIISSPIIAVLLVATIVFVIFRGYRQGSGAGLLKTLLRPVVTVGVIVAMVAGAGNSTGGGQGGGNYNPGTMSPGWIASTMSKVVDSAANVTAVTASLTQGSISAINVSTDEPSCTSYTATLRNAYANSSTSTATPVALNSIWENTGLNSWIVTQFGANTYAYKTYCHLLEWNAGTSPSMQKAVIDRTSGFPRGVDVESLALGPAAYSSSDSADSSISQNSLIDQSLVAWAQCKWDGSGWTGAWNKTNSQTNVAEDCDHWWDKSGNAWSDGQGFAIKSGQNNIYSALSDSNQNAKDYVMALHGESSPGGMVTPFLYLISAIISLFVFGGMSLVVMLAKFALLFYMVAMLFVLLLSMWPGKADDRLVSNFFKDLLGITLISWGYGLILGILILFTSLIIGLTGATVTSAGSTNTMGALLVSAIAPLGAVLLIKHLFKNMLHLPDPMSPKGALAFGAMGGSIAGAGMSALMNRGGSGGSGSGLLSRAAGAVKNKAAGSNGGAGPNSKGSSADGTEGGMASAGEGVSRGDLRWGKRDRRNEINAQAAEARRSAIEKKRAAQAARLAASGKGKRGFLGRGMDALGQKAAGAKAAMMEKSRINNGALSALSDKSQKARENWKNGRGVAGALNLPKSLSNANQAFWDASSRFQERAGLSGTDKVNGSGFKVAAATAGGALLSAKDKVSDGLAHLGGYSGAGDEDWQNASMLRRAADTAGGAARIAAGVSAEEWSEMSGGARARQLGKRAAVGTAIAGAAAFGGVPLAVAMGHAALPAAVGAAAAIKGGQKLRASVQENRAARADDILERASYFRDVRTGVEWGQPVVAQSDTLDGAPGPVVAEAPTVVQPIQDMPAVGGGASPVVESIPSMDQPTQSIPPTGGGAGTVPMPAPRVEAARDASGTVAAMSGASTATATATLVGEAPVRRSARDYASSVQAPGAAEAQAIRSAQPAVTQATQQAPGVTQATPNARPGVTQATPQAQPAVTPVTQQAPGVTQATPNARPGVTQATQQAQPAVTPVTQQAPGVTQATPNARPGVTQATQQAPGVTQATPNARPGVTQATPQAQPAVTPVTQQAPGVTQATPNARPGVTQATAQSQPVVTPVTQQAPGVTQATQQAQPAVTPVTQQAPGVTQATQQPQPAAPQSDADRMAQGAFERMLRTFGGGQQPQQQTGAQTQYGPFSQQPDTSDIQRTIDETLRQSEDRRARRADYEAQRFSESIRNAFDESAQRNADSTQPSGAETTNYSAPERRYRENYERRGSDMVGEDDDDVQERRERRIQERARRRAERRRTNGGGSL